MDKPAPIETRSEAGAEAAKAIEVTVADGIGLLTLNRPDRINAINDDIRHMLPDGLEMLDDDPAVRVIVIHGGEGRGFCAGADITEKRAPLTPVETRSRNMRQGWVDALDRTAKPTIAAIHGYCLGGGLELALACDIRIASTDALFSLPETGLGLIPGAGGTQRLHRIIGLGRALDLLLTGDRIDAAEAYRLGLVTRLVDQKSELLDGALKLAGVIAARAPVATLYVKEAARSGADLPLAAGMALERSLFALLTSTDDSREAARAFGDKRRPSFSGT